MTSAWDMATWWAIARGGWPWAMVGARVLGMAATAPAWGSLALGWRLRIVLVGLVTFLIAPAVAIEPRPFDPGAIEILAMEAGIGAALGLSMALVLAGARQAGELVGMQAGLAPASLLDPDAGGEMTPLGHLYGMIALAAFLALDGPLTLVTSLAESYRAIPPGGVAFSEETLGAIFGRVGEALGLAIRIASPAALALIVAGLAMGLIGRAAPAISLFSLTMPIRVAVGLVVILVSLAMVAGLLSASWSSGLF